MFKMLEVVGTSPESFSVAVQDAVEKASASGGKLHFFQVVEQRGAIREGKVKEFQVILKIATEMI
jgi:hypothetical protein